MCAEQVGGTVVIVVVVNRCLGNAGSVFFESVFSESVFSKRVFSESVFFESVYTLFVIDMHQNRSISLFSTPSDHF